MKINSDLLGKKLSIKNINEFLPKRFPKLFPQYFYLGYGDFESNELDLIWEIEGYGLKIINDIETIIPVDFEEAIRLYNMKMNYLGVLRNLMILNDYKKYIKVYNEIWDLSCLKSSEDFFNFYNIKVDEILKLAETK